MSSLFGVEFVHATKYYEKGIASDGPYYRVEYYIDHYYDSDRFVNLLMGLGSGAPHRHPLCPNVICAEARCVQGLGKPVLSSNGLPDYSGGALIDAIYKNPGSAYQGATTDLAIDDPFGRNQIDPATPLVWCTQELDFEVETISLPNTYFEWSSDSKKSTVQYIEDVHITTLNLTFPRLTELPILKIRNYRGRINSIPFLGADAETVLFVGARTRRESSIDGILNQSVSLVFKERDRSWNMFLRPDTGEWDYLQSPTTLRRRYETADLNDLIRLI